MGLSSSAFDTALRSLYIALFALPGYLLAIFTVNPLGRWNIQMVRLSLCTQFGPVLSFASIANTQA
jgi:hypothetical protein